MCPFCACCVLNHCEVAAILKIGVFGIITLEILAHGGQYLKKSLPAEKAEVISPRLSLPDDPDGLGVPLHLVDVLRPGIIPTEGSTLNSRIRLEIYS